jgi:hypothetical protein
MDCEKYQVFIEPSADRRLSYHIEFLSRVSKNAANRLYKSYEDALGFLL